MKNKIITMIMLLNLGLEKLDIPFWINTIECGRRYFELVFIKVLEISKKQASYFI